MIEVKGAHSAGHIVVEEDYQINNIDRFIYDQPANKPCVSANSPPKELHPQRRSPYIRWE